MSTLQTATTPTGTDPTQLGTATVHLGLPKGRMHEGIVRLLADAGIKLRTTSRGYRPSLSLPGFETKILKPQNIIEMIKAGSRDVGFVGADWVSELARPGEPEPVDLLDTELDPVRIVAAAPLAIVENGVLKLPEGRPLVVVSEMPRLTKAWIERRGYDARLVRSYGATEVFPPEDADCIVDITQSGATLEANNLVIFDELLRSSTRLYASPRALENPAKRERIDQLVLLLRSVLDARGRVMLELNVPADRREAIIRALPCMREPTVSELNAGAGHAIKAAVQRDKLPELIPQLKSLGGSDIVITPLSQVVP